MNAFEIFRFELCYQLRRPAVWIHFLAVVGLLLLVFDEIVEYARTVEVVLLNAPLTIADLTGFSNKFGLLLIAALVGDGAMRDVQTRMDPLFYTSSISKIAYVGGRILGTFVLAGGLLFLAVVLSLLIGHYAYGVEASFYGPFRPLAYVNAWLFLSLPSAFFATVLLYALVLTSRQAMAAYAGGALLFLLGQFSLGLSGNWDLAQLLDASGAAVLDALQRSLTPLQAQTLLVQFEGNLLVNRGLWFGITVLVGVLALTRFKLSYHTSGFGRKRPTPPVAEQTVQARPIPVKVPLVERSFGFRTRVYQIGALALRAFRDLMLSPAGFSIPGMSFVAFLLVGLSNKGPFAYAMLPATSRVTQLLHHPAIGALVVLLLTVFAGQLVWRERDARLQDIADAAPVSDAVLLLSKYVTLVLLLVALQAAVLVGGVSLQLLKGYEELEPGLYLQVLFGFQLVDYLLFAAAAMSIHVLVNQKYVGHLVALLFYLYTLLPARFGIEHKLLIFASDPGLATSTFYGQSAFIGPWLLFKLYWTGWALLLTIGAKLLWVRGRETGFRQRLQQACQRLGYTAKVVSAAAGLLVFFSGSLIFYNTNMLHDYVTAGERREQQVAYERLYGHYRNIPQPHLAGTKLHIELYPSKRSAVLQGTYQLKNSSGVRIDSIHVALSPEVKTSGLRFNRKGHVVLDDKKQGYLIYALAQPLAPEDSLQMQYRISYRPNSFSNTGVATAVMEKSTWITSWEWLPAIGYQRDRELGSNSMRAAYGLPKRKATGSLQDTIAWYDGNGRERIAFEATIGTALGQVAVAPGTLKRSWVQKGRQYTHFVADQPIRNMYHLYAAPYKVRKTTWNGTGIQLFYLPQHVLNLDRIAHAMKASLTYYTKRFGPYPYDLLKFAEYPDTGTGGISLPGAISYSSNFALLNPDGDERGFDLPFAVAAHEVAHQWWGHQLIPAAVEGGAFLSESLAWYSAFGVVEQEKGAEQLQKLLDAMRQEFLNPRSRAGAPLLRAADNFQAYRTGPLALYALREYIGEKHVNEALRHLLRMYSAGKPPYATSLDFYKEVKAVTPDSLQYLLQDLFAKNTYWELSTKRAHAAQAGAGHWLVTMEVEARKVQVDTANVITEVPMNDLIEVGVYGPEKVDEPAKLLYLHKLRIRSGKQRIRVRVAAKPAVAGVDPRHLLLDTDRQDNVKKVGYTR